MSNICRTKYLKEQYRCLLVFSVCAILLLLIFESNYKNLIPDGKLSSYFFRNTKGNLFVTKKVSFLSVPVMKTGTTTFSRVTTKGVKVTSGKPTTILTSSKTLNMTSGKPTTILTSSKTLNMTSGKPITILTSSKTLNMTSGKPITILTSSKTLNMTSGKPITILTSSKTLNMTSGKPITILTSSKTLNMTSGKPITILTSSKTLNMTSGKPTTILTSVGFKLVSSPPAKPITYYLCPGYIGRLGNLLFEYASAYGTARKKNLTFIVTKTDRINTIFQVDEIIEVRKNAKLCQNAKRINEKRSCAFNNESITFKTGFSVILNGYRQSWKYFIHVEDELRKQLVFRNHILQKALKSVSGIKQKYLGNGSTSRNVTFVGVHVRRGDMVNNPHGYLVAPHGYFKKAMQFFRSKFSDIVFVVCSDDLPWSEKNLLENGTYFVRGNPAEVDMAVLSLCNHTIMSVGSFGWWSSWLANGITTYYANPARPGSSLRKQFSSDMKDYYCPGWISMA